jgi:hypothetical protein
MTREEEIAEEIYQERKRFAYMENQSLMDMAATAWWNDYGMLPASYFAKAYRVDLRKLTILIQKQMSEKVGIPLPNTAPKVEVYNTEQELNAYYPKASALSLPYTPELFYYLKYGFQET